MRMAWGEKTRQFGIADRGIQRHRVYNEFITFVLPAEGGKIKKYCFFTVCPVLLIPTVYGGVVTSLDVCLKQDTRLREIVEHHGARNWRMVAEQLGTPRSDVQCLHRWAL